MHSDDEKNNYEANEEKVRINGGWITDEFLQEVISQSENNKNTCLIGSKITAAVGAGDNYLSIMYQMSAEVADTESGRRETRQFLIKGLPSAKFLREMIDEFGIFRKELYMYNVCLPAMRRIMEEYIPDEEDFIAARSYPCSVPDVLVLEDLKLSGYRMAHRREQLDFEHASVVLKSLARFHALSVRLVRSKPEVVEILSKYEFYSYEKKPKLYGHVVKGFRSWLKVMNEDDSMRDFVPVMEKATKNVLDKMVYVVNKKNGSFVAVNHGDSWTNNFLFRYDRSGGVNHAKIVDFQLVRYSSIVLDLLYFLMGSCRPDMLLERFIDLVKIYHSALTADIRKLRIDESECPTVEDILNDMRACSIFGIASLIILTPIIVAKPSDVADFENVDAEEVEKSEDYMLEKNFRDSLYKELVVKYMKFFEDNGYLKAAEDLVVENPGSTNSD